jgi:opacity protein-like surface antigen
MPVACALPIMMRTLLPVLTMLSVVAVPAVAGAQSHSWTPEVSVGAGLGHVFRWEDQTFGDRLNAGGGVAIALRSGWAFEWHADHTFGLEPRQAPCGLVNVTCVGSAHEGPTQMTVTSFNVRRYFGDGRVRPFLTGGLGVMWSRSSHSITRVQGSIATISEFATGDSGFGPDLGGGIRVRIARSWSAEAAVRWLDAPWLSRQNLAVTRLLVGASYAMR